MKNLGHTIDRLKTVLPKHRPVLQSIKTKWKKYPKREELYWGELLKVLNEDEIRNSGGWEKVKRIINPPVNTRKIKYSIPPMHSSDKVLGVLPEDLSDKIKRYDRSLIALEKKKVEAAITRDSEDLTKIRRSAYIHEIRIKKLWIDIKDKLNLWHIDNGTNISLRDKDGLLVVIHESRQNIHPFQGMGRPGSGKMISMDEDSLRNLFNSMGIDPPPELFDN